MSETYCIGRWGLIAVQLMNQFGMIGVPTSDDGAAAKPTAGRYVGSLR